MPITKLISLIRWFSFTVGLVILWKIIYPMCVQTIALAPLLEGKHFGAIDPEDAQTWMQILLFYSTLLFYHYQNGWIEEWKMLCSDGLSIMNALFRWSCFLLLAVIVPPFTALAMYWALKGHTQVPHPSIYIASWVYFLILSLIAWLYPLWISGSYQNYSPLQNIIDC